jgi:cell division protein FtsW
MANYLVRHGNEARQSLKGVVKPMVALASMGLLLLLEPDFGATVVLFVTALGMMFMGGVRIRWFSILIACAVLAVVLLVIFSPYRLARLTGFLHPWDNQLDTGYQLTQSLIAFGRGGIFGVGLGNSIQKLFYLPEAHTDFVFAIIAEELGLIGVLLLLGLFIVLVWRGLSIARIAHLQKEMFDAYLAYGITFWLGMQVVVNIGVNVGLLPTKGLTLPFISYGGSSLVVDCMAAALLLRVDYQNKLRGLDKPYMAGGELTWRK